MQFAAFCLGLLPPVQKESKVEVVPAQRPLAVSISRACAETSLSQRTMYRLIESGQVRTAKVGRRTLVLTASLAELLGEADE